MDPANSEDFRKEFSFSKRFLQLFHALFRFDPEAMLADPEQLGASNSPI